MKKRNEILKKVSVAFCMMMAVVMLVQMPVMAKSSKNYLIKSVKVATKSKAYWFNRTATYKYNNKKNITQLVEAYGGQKAATTAYKYKYKKGNPTKMTQTQSYTAEKQKYTQTYTYKKGRIVSAKRNSGSEDKYSYNSHGDVKKYSSSYTSDGKKFTSASKYNYKYYKNGLPKTMKEYFNNEWRYTYNYNQKGLITKVKSNEETSKYKYKYNRNGTVKSVVCTYYNAANEIVRTQTCTFSYTKKQVSKSRYARMINCKGAFSPVNYF